MSKGGEGPGTDWSEAELRASVEVYFAMLRQQLAGETVNKAEWRRKLQERIPARSDGAIEYRHQNISAVMVIFGAPCMPGYLPAKNIPKSLIGIVGEELDRSSIPEFAVEPTRVLDELRKSGVRVRHVPPPKPLMLTERDAEELSHRRTRVYRNTDWAAREALNRKLGSLGEELVLDWERFELRRQGRADLASRVVHASKEEGDGLGFDIRSYRPDGTRKLIEVKTTNGGSATPFYVTPRELAVSQECETEFVLGRVYEASSRPSWFELCGNLKQRCSLTPAAYLAEVRHAS